jgi:hypothetical protein
VGTGRSLAQACFHPLLQYVQIVWLGQRPRDLTPDRATRCLDMQRQPLSTRPSNPHDLADLPSRTPIGAQGEP